MLLLEFNKQNPYSPSIKVLQPQQSCQVQYFHDCIKPLQPTAIATWRCSARMHACGWPVWKLLLFRLHLLIRLSEGITVTLPKPIYSIINFADLQKDVRGRGKQTIFNWRKDRRHTTGKSYFLIQALGSYHHLLQLTASLTVFATLPVSLDYLHHFIFSSLLSDQPSPFTKVITNIIQTTQHQKEKAKTLSYFRYISSVIKSGAEIPSLLCIFSVRFPEVEPGFFFSTTFSVSLWNNTETSQVASTLEVKLQRACTVQRINFFSWGFVTCGQWQYHLLVRWQRVIS